jgi:5-methylcytosine-specific restriction endonuclease McrA
MSNITHIVTAHPLDELPYNKITFSHLDGKRTPIYKVENLEQHAGAKLTLSFAFQKYGGTCFYCRKSFKPAAISQDITRDHIQPRSKGGGDHLHNLVIACGGCNRNKKDKELARSHRDAADRYLKALDKHLIKCLQAL